ncbi:MAG: hypothetical protein RL302_2404 [Pseudomonadota bacterium]|jgi:ATP-dependent DNA helicase DinG
MDLRRVVAQAFEPGGPLSDAVEAFSPRAGQTQMALEVASTIEAGGVLVVEAGTGVGKTFAYLIPTLLSGERVLLSTATKALQDQLFKRDIPRLMAVLGVAARVALLKGRSSYLCLHRLEEARQCIAPNDARALLQLAQVESWAHATRDGDLAELEQLDDSSPVIPLVTSTRDNCLGTKCPQIQSCHVNQARRVALGADLVVVNHHLFFADLNVRESGVAELLPSVRSVVFDEAHQLSEIGVQFLGQQFSTGQVLSFASDLLRTGQQHARGFAPWDRLVSALQQAVQDLCQMMGTRTGRLAWRDGLPQGVSQAPWLETTQGLLDAMGASHNALTAVTDVSPEMTVLKERVRGLREGLTLFLSDTESGYVRWLDLGQQVRMVHSPMDIAQAMQSRVLGLDGGETPGKSWIFTSATLGHDATLGLFLQSCGLESARVLQVQSPFDYPSQAAIYVPQDMPAPADPGHAQAVAQLVAQGACVLGGRTLVLTTTLRAMRGIGAALRETLVGQNYLQVLVQGEASKRELVARFCRADNDGQPGCVLVASASFWEGIDVPGDALQLLVIDKLPFAPPDDPLQEAKAAQLQSLGKNAFRELQLPQAAVALKQGAGRLIRRETDRGVLVVCDVRLQQKSYGKKLLAALPAMRRLESPSQWMEALEALTTPSTTDPYWFSPPW